MAELENDDIDMLKGAYGHCGQEVTLPEHMGIQYSLKRLKPLVL